ncbi:G-protein-signaling modulator 1 [Scomber scombrus]
MAEGGLLEPLVITEEGDISEAVTVRSSSGESALKEREEHSGGDKNETDVASEMCSEEQQTNTTEEDVFFNVERKPEESENVKDGQNRDGSERDGQTHKVMKTHEIPATCSGTKDKTVAHVDVNTLNSSELKPEDTKKAHRLTPDFPDALFELLCTLQEGRRLNDQRCSFRLENGMGRRRCHSEPNATKPANRVIFSSMTSLQKEEFFEFVATTQARRLDDQRAQLERSPPPKPKARTFRGSIKQLSFVKKPEKPAPVPAPKEDLYNMILTTQAQGRLEDQRSRAPGPMDDEDFFSLLLRVQGGRMDEQRTELPCLLQT